MKNKYYIYIHFKKGTDIPFYIGKGIGYRLGNKYKSGRNPYQHNIVNKYGFEAFKIEEDLTEQQTFESEIYWIEQFKAWGFNLCNMTNGGDGAIGHKTSEETKKKISNALKGIQKKPFTEEHKQKLRLINVGRKQTKEQIMKRTNSNIGKKRTEEARERISNSLKGNKNSFGEKNGLSKLTEKKVLEIREKYIPRKYSQRKLAKEYGVAQAVIYGIVNKKYWKHI